MKTFTTAEAALLAGITISDLLDMIRQRKIFPVPRPLGPMFEAADPEDLYLFTRADVQAIGEIAANPGKQPVGNRVPQPQRKLKSPQFKPFPPIDNTDYSPADLAAAWNYSVDTIRELFRNEKGVIKLPAKRKRKDGGHETMRIPPDVAVRVRRRMTEV